MAYRGSLMAAVTAGLMLAAGSPVAAQHGGPPPAAQADATVQSDLAVLREFMSLDRSFSPAARAAAMDRIAWLEAHAAEQTRAGMALEAARIAALADNGHTLSIGGLAGAASGRIPYRTIVMEGRVYAVVSPDPELLGAELLSVDGVPVGTLRAAWVENYQGGTIGHRDDGLPIFIETPAALHAAGLIQNPEQVTVTFKTADGRTMDRVLTPQTGGHTVNALRMAGMAATAPNGGPVPLYMQNPRLFFATAPLPELNALYVKMQAVVNGGGQEIRPFLSATEAEIASLRPTNVVLDLRFNSGGDLNNARNFAKALARRLPANGRVFVITSRTTFSAAISTLGYLKEAGGDKVVIVGEPVGDRLEFWAEGRPLPLPWSGALLLYATERHNYMTGCPEEDCHGPIRRNPIRVTSLEPDLPAPMTIDAFMAGRDPALEAIEAYLRR